MDAISTEFYDQHYKLFTPAGRIMEQIAEPPSWKEMQELVGADFQGLYVRGTDGKVKEALYNTFDTSPHTPKWNAQQPYRESISENFDLAKNRVGPGETLVLHMFGRDGWCLEATRPNGPGDATFVYKHCSGYGRILYRRGCDDRGTYEYVIRGEGERPAEGYSGPVEIHLIDQDFWDVQGSIDPVSWSPLPKQTLRISSEPDGYAVADDDLLPDEASEGGSVVVLMAEPIRSAAAAPEDDYIYSATEYDKPQSEGGVARVHLKLKPTSWNNIMRFLNVHANRLSVS